MKNSLAGKFKGKSKSSEYFAKNKEARDKKNAYNKEYHATTERKKYRAALNKKNRETNGYGDGLDKSHTSSGNMVNEKPSRNRARNGRGNTRRLR